MRALVLALSVSAAAGFSTRHHVGPPAAFATKCSSPTALESSRRHVLEAMGAAVVMGLPSAALAADFDDLAMPTADEQKTADEVCEMNRGLFGYACGGRLLLRRTGSSFNSISTHTCCHESGDIHHPLDSTLLQCRAVNPICCELPPLEQGNIIYLACS